MTMTFQRQERPADFAKYREQWEGALLARAVAENSELSPGERRQVLRTWFQGLYNAASYGVSDGFGAGELEWRAAGPTQFDCVYAAPYGLRCNLARVYEQPDGSWAALVIAGVKASPNEAMDAALWAISRLSS